MGSYWMGSLPTLTGLHTLEETRIPSHIHSCTPSVNDWGSMLLYVSVYESVSSTGTWLFETKKSCMIHIYDIYGVLWLGMVVSGITVATRPAQIWQQLPFNHTGEITSLLIQYFSAYYYTNLLCINKCNDFRLFFYGRQYSVSFIICENNVSRDRLILMSFTERISNPS